MNTNYSIFSYGKLNFVSAYRTRQINSLKYEKFHKILFFSQIALHIRKKMFYNVSSITSNYVS